MSVSAPPSPSFFERKYSDAKEGDQKTQEPPIPTLDARIATIEETVKNIRNDLQTNLFFENDPITNAQRLRSAMQQILSPLPLPAVAGLERLPLPTPIIFQREFSTWKEALPKNLASLLFNPKTCIAALGLAPSTFPRDLLPPEIDYYLPEIDRILRYSFGNIFITSDTPIGPTPLNLYLCYLAYCTLRSILLSVHDRIQHGPAYKLIENEEPEPQYDLSHVIQMANNQNLDFKNLSKLNDKRLDWFFNSLDEMSPATNYRIQRQEFNAQIQKERNDRAQQKLASTNLEQKSIALARKPFYEGIRNTTLIAGTLFTLLLTYNFAMGHIPLAPLYPLAIGGIIDVATPTFIKTATKVAKSTAEKALSACKWVCQNPGKVAVVTGTTAIAAYLGDVSPLLSPTVYTTLAAVVTYFGNWAKSRFGQQQQA